VRKKEAGPLTAIFVRAFDPSEWEIFRSLRLQALTDEPGVFAASYDSAAALSPVEWQDTVQGPDHQVFGLFDEAHLIGITAAFTWRDDPSGETALLAMSFIIPEYRGRGLSQLLYEARLNWVRAHSHFRRVVIYHRESNERSRRANQRFGFSVLQRASRKWPDGATEDEVLYELKINRSDAKKN
jgi:RimJ/RimL family protein N-acetyltransferase